METKVETTVDAPRDVVWRVVSDIENAARTVAGIEQVEVLERPGPGLLGLKWRETRTLFGKTATETMWITEVDEGRSYATEARSHGSVYRSRLRVEDAGGGTRLSMAFRGEPESVGAKLLTATMGRMMRNATRKALQQDLEDIKRAAEDRHRAGPDAGRAAVQA